MKRECPQCWGDGVHEFSGDRCWSCLGTGEIGYDPEDDDEFDDDPACDACGDTKVMPLVQGDPSNPDTLTSRDVPCPICCKRKATDD